MLNLPGITFFFTWVTPLIAIVIALIYGLKYEEKEDWFVLEDLFKKDERKEKEGDQ